MNLNDGNESFVGPNINRYGSGQQVCLIRYYADNSNFCLWTKP